jgi:hypothetical protein
MTHDAPRAVFEIIALLGAGGMGEVYRAHDPRLRRDVALTILPADVAADGERLARFEREAQVLAGLNHPQIAAIYGIEDAGALRALVLELVAGARLRSESAAAPSRCRRPWRSRRKLPMRWTRHTNEESCTGTCSRLTSRSLPTDPSRSSISVSPTCSTPRRPRRLPRPSAPLWALCPPGSFP